MPASIWRALDVAARIDIQRIAAPPPGAARLTIAQLAPHDRALQLLRLERGRAADRGAHEEAYAAARALAERDPGDVFARAMLHLERAGHRELGLYVVSYGPRGVQPMARLFRAHRAHPEDASLILGMAARSLDHGLYGDALALAQDAERLTRRDDERSTARLIAALAELESGAPRTHALQPLEGGDAARSVLVASRIALAARSRPDDPWLRAHAPAARARLLEAGMAGPFLPEMALDPLATAEQRARAADVLWAGSRPWARAVAECGPFEPRSRDVAPPRTVHELICAYARDALTEEARIEIGEGSPPNLENETWRAFEGYPEVFSLRFEGTRHELLPATIRGRILARVAQRDLAGARAIFEELGGLLLAWQRVMLRSFFADPAAGPEQAPTLADALSIAGPAEYALHPLAQDPVPAPAPSPAPDVALASGPLYARLASAYSSGLPASANDGLGLEIERLAATDPERAIVAGYAGAIADALMEREGTTDPGFLVALAGLARESAPDSLTARLLDALASRRSGDGASAAAAWADVLGRAWASYPQRRAWLEASLSAQVGVPPAVVAAIASPFVRQAIDLGAPPTVEAALRYENLGAGTAALDEVLSLPPEIVGQLAPGRIPNLLRRVLASTAAPAEVIDLFRRARPVIDADARPNRLWRVAARIAVGEGEAAIAACDEPLEGWDACYSGEVLRVLAQVRASLDDALAVTLVRELILGESTHDPETMVRLRAAAASQPAATPLFCALLTLRADDPGALLDACMPAFRALADPVIAGRLSWALLVGPDAARERGLDAGAFFAEAHRRLGDRVEATLLHNEALFEHDRGNRDRAVALEIDAQAHGMDRDQLGVIDYAQLPRRGLLVRAQVALAPAERAFLALGEPRLVAAELYARTAAHAIRGEERSAAVDRALAARDVIAWAVADLAAGRIDERGLQVFDEARRQDFTDLNLEIAEQYPSSALAAYGAMVIAIRRRDLDAALRYAEVVERVGSIGSMAITLAPELGMQRGRAEAEALLARARALDPEDPRLAPVDPASLLPAPLASPEAFHALLEGADLGPWIAEAERRAFAELGVESMVWRELRATSPGWAQTVPAGPRFGTMTEPRQSECSGEACLEPTITVLERNGYTEIWRAPATLPIGQGARVMMSNGANVIVMAAVPMGTRVLFSGVSGGAADVIEMIGGRALIEQTIRPLDAVVGSSSAEALRQRTAQSAITPEVRVAALRALASAGDDGSGCPLSSEILPADGPARAALVLDMYLALDRAPVRRALPSCGARSGALGVAALLDHDIAAHRAGVEILAREPASALEAARAVVSLPSEHALAGIPRSETAIPPFGAAEVLAALPALQARTLAAELFHGSDRRLRLLAAVSEHVRPGTLDPIDVQRGIQTAEADVARELTMSHWASLSPADLEAIRARADATQGSLDRDALELAVVISNVLEESLDVRDAPRLRALAERVRSGAAAEDRGYADWAARQIEDAAALIEASEQREVSDAASGSRRRAAAAPCVPSAPRRPGPSRPSPCRASFLGTAGATCACLSPRS